MDNENKENDQTAARKASLSAPPCSEDMRLAVKMHQYLKRKARENPHKAALGGDVGWMHELIYLVRITDAQKEDSQNSPVLTRSE